MDSLFIDTLVITFTALRHPINCRMMLIIIMYLLHGLNTYALFTGTGM